MTVREEDRSERLAIRAGAGAAAELDRRAKEAGMSRSAYVRQQLGLPEPGANWGGFRVPRGYVKAGSTAA